jgi:tetratricopeptide (TPR) repeat protein
MELRNAFIAFALTMAALATVVTVLMESGLRIARMRKKNFIEVMKLLNKELDKGPFGENGALGLSRDERWDFLVRVVNNPAEAAFEQIKPEVENLTTQGLLDYWGKDKAANLPVFKRCWNFLANIARDKKRACLYEGVSLEYLLRCLVNTPTIKAASWTASETLKVEFNRLAKKYEEFGSSVSASFKHHSQYWSILIGIVLAVFVNIDALRIFNAYRADPALVNAVIEKQEALLKNHESVQASIDEFKKAEAAFAKAKLEFSEAQKGGDTAIIENAESVMNEAEKALQEKTSIKETHEILKNAQMQLADLEKAGVPIGWNYYPYCPYGEADSVWETSSPKCRDIPQESRKLETKYTFLRIIYTLWVDWARFFTWLIVTIISGILIGLGAPFWFDVAKRLSAIRKGLQSATASSEYRLSGKNANGDPKERNEIVNAIITEARAESAVSGTTTPGGS